MAALAYNAETGDRSQPVSREVRITVLGKLYEFTIWCSKYTDSKLTREDWQEAGRQLREAVPTIRMAMAANGDLFASNAAECLTKQLYDTLRHLLLERFRDRQVKAGNMRYQVDSLLAGDEYRV